MNTPITIPFLDEDEINEVTSVLKSGWLTQGSKVAEFEKSVAEHEGAKYASAVTSCTTALFLALKSKGLSSGMDAIVPSFTFVATANAVVETGAVPVLVDVDKCSYNIAPEKLIEAIESLYEFDGERLVNRKSKNVLWGIVPVHQFGLCCDIYKVNAIAKEYGIEIIEDSACALGSGIDGVKQGSFGNISCISFHPRKSITTGEGGMILANEESIDTTIKKLRNHGAEIDANIRHKGGGFLLPDYNAAGYNYRMNDIQAAVGIAQMKKLDEIIKKKQSVARKYDKLIEEMLPDFIHPCAPKNYFHTYQSYVGLLDMKGLNLESPEEGGIYRNRLLAKLEEAGIATRQGTHAVHTLKYYINRFGFKPSDIPNAYELDKLTVSLPIYVGITEEQQFNVIDEMRRGLYK